MEFSIHQVDVYVEGKKKELQTLQIELDKLKSLILEKKVRVSWVRIKAIIWK